MRNTSCRCYLGPQDVILVLQHPGPRNCFWLMPRKTYCNNALKAIQNGFKNKSDNGFVCLENDGLGVICKPYKFLKRFPKECILSQSVFQTQAKDMYRHLTFTTASPVLAAGNFRCLHTLWQGRVRTNRALWCPVRTQSHCVLTQCSNHSLVLFKRHFSSWHSLSSM